jgi:hypothetical protein
LEPPDEIERLLTEIRDIQREHLEEYRRATAQFAEIQSSAIEVQKQALKIRAAAISRARWGLYILGAALILLGWLIASRG